MSGDPENPDMDASRPRSGEALFNWPRKCGRLDEVMAAIHRREQRQKFRRARQWGVGVVAAIVLAAGLSSYPFADSDANNPRLTASSATVTQPEKQILPDGTRVELKRDSEIAVHYTVGERRVVLRRGEAHFEVEKDAERIFVVDAGGVEFRAVGTAFAVQLEAKRVEMIVTEGRVAVARSDAQDVADPKNPALTIVDAGSQAEVRFDGQTVGPAAVQALAPQQMSERLAWRVPRLELSETPLHEVVAAFNHLGRVRIEIGERALENLAISGILRADNAGALVRVLENNYGIRAEQGPSEKIVLRAAERK